MAIILTISHNVFLTREERYALYNGNSITVVGVSIPVWVKKGRLPHDAEEIFCKYLLRNNGKPKKIEPAPTGHVITIPPTSNQYWKELMPNDVWRSMDEDAKAKWYEKNTRPNPNQLLDLIDGGADGYLSFSHQTEVKKISVLHFVEIKPIELLQKSLV
ncbi:MAG: hypothetical protein M0R80_08570 [Proteobacteria bacterium]|jgi:hypothetical protein|nr:hypothetical protein [Pseudomonadota bacterium]